MTNYGCSNYLGVIFFKMNKVSPSLQEKQLTVLPGLKCELSSKNSSFVTHASATMSLTASPHLKNFPSKIGGDINDMIFWI